MSKAEQYREYAAECWRSAWERARNRENRMAQAARWMALASMAEKAEHSDPVVGPSQWRGVQPRRRAVG
jgi:hypothetical protein